MIETKIKIADLTKTVECSRLGKKVEVIEDSFTTCSHYTGNTLNCGDCDLVAGDVRDSVCLVLA